MSVGKFSSAGEEGVQRARAGLEVGPQDLEQTAPGRRGLLQEEGPREEDRREHVRAAAGEEQARGI